MAAEYPGVQTETDPVAEADLAAHVAAADPHTQYQKESEKAANNGYASLDSGGQVPLSQLGNAPTGGGGGADASTTVKGISKLSVAPVSGTNPIAVGDNDPRNTNTRTPADASVTDAKIATTLSQSKVTNLVTDLAAKAPLASPTFTGTPAAPTAAQGTNTTQLASTAYVQTEAGLLIPKSLVDAKGDVLVGSADNAVARLAVGSDGQVLTADAASTNGIKWAAATGGSAPTYVTSLPGSPTDGQEVFYAADATNGVIWHLRYRSGATGSYKWEFVGGPPLLSRVATDEGTASATYTALTTAGPSITVPLAGDFIVTIAAVGYNNVGNAQNYMSYSIGATAASDSDRIYILSTSVDSSQGSQVKTLSSAATALVSKYRTSSGTGNFFSRVMTVAPIRVG